jgi:hypothetical protein
VIGLSVILDDVPYDARKDALRSLFRIVATLIVGLLVVLSVLYPPPSTKADRELSAWYQGLPMLEWSDKTYINRKSVTAFAKLHGSRTSKSNPFANTFDEQQVIILNYRNGIVEGLLLRKVSEYFFIHKKSEKEVKVGFKIPDGKGPASILKQMRRYDLTRSIGFKILYFSLWELLVIACVSYPSLTKWWTQSHGMQRRESIIREFKHYIEIRKQTLLLRKMPSGETRISLDDSYRRHLYMKLLIS